MFIFARPKQRRLEQVLHVHPEKYREDAQRYKIPGSNRHTRNNTPVPKEVRSRSTDFTLPVPRMDGANGSLLAGRGGVASSSSSPHHSDESLHELIEENENSLFDEILTINVSGLHFQTYERTLARYGNTLLGNKEKRSLFYNPNTNEYFFDRSRSAFEAILYIYQSRGRVKRPESVPIDVFIRELRFFQMGEHFMEEFWKSEGYEKPKEHLMPKHNLQKKVWELMEYPDSSLGARIVAFISIAVIVVSIVSFCWETVPSAEERENQTLADLLTRPTIIKEEEVGQRYSNPFFWLEFICIIWFTIELFLRFISCPCKYTFLTSFLNIIDFIAIAPFFANMIWSDASKANSSMSFAVLRVLRLVRVFRIFKLSRHSVGLQILGKTFKASIQEFCLLIFFMVIALVLFSSGMYFAEQGEPNTKFTSIPASFWFVLIRRSRPNGNLRKDRWFSMRSNRSANTCTTRAYHRGQLQALLSAGEPVGDHEVSTSRGRRGGGRRDVGRLTTTGVARIGRRRGCEFVCKS